MARSALLTAGTATRADLPASLRHAPLDDAGWRRATLAPTALVLLLLTVLPLVHLFLVSFFEIRWVDQQAAWRFVGGANYAAIPADGLVRAGLVNTLVFVAAAVTLELLIGLALALLCSRIGRGRTLYRMIFLLPILIPGIVIGAIWKLLYNYDFGIINQLIALGGLAPQDWLGDPATALAAVIVVDIWHWTPFCFLLLLASLESLPVELHEAARIDGASAWQELWWVTLPMMAPAILVTAIFRTITAFKVFDEVFLLTGGGPGTATEVLSFTIYQRFFTEDRIGYGAALSTATIFIIALLLILALASRRREGMEP
jgi:multiple sugar transport system permease protein